ncbi:MAG TPA: hypothetical protein VF126_15515, partial [Acidobacteriaceae bacterium]
MITNPNEVEDLEGQLRQALRREDAPVSVAAGVDARLRGASMYQAPLEPHLLNPVVDEPVWQTIWGNLVGLFQREKLPPLVLTSHPVAVVDPFRVKRSPLSSALSVGAHVAVIALIIFLVIEAGRHPQAVKKSLQMAHVDISPFR